MMTCAKFQHCYLSMQFKLAPLSSSSFAFLAFLSPSNRYQLGLPSNLRIRFLHPLSQSLSFIHSICSNLFRTLRSTRPLIISPLKLTYEIECNINIVFLDTLLSRTEDGLTKTVFRKETSTRKCLRL